MYAPPHYTCTSYNCRCTKVARDWDRDRDRDNGTQISYLNLGPGGSLCLLPLLFQLNLTSFTRTLLHTTWVPRGRGVLSYDICGIWHVAEKEMTIHWLGPRARPQLRTAASSEVTRAPVEYSRNLVKCTSAVLNCMAMCMAQEKRMAARWCLARD